MSRKRAESIGEPIAQLQRELEEYRRLRPRRAKLPEAIWDAAAELAREHGVHAVCVAKTRSRQARDGFRDEEP
jgi:fibrillarin-like rRNA methylase